MAALGQGPANYQLAGVLEGEQIASVRHWRVLVKAHFSSGFLRQAEWRFIC